MTCRKIVFFVAALSLLLTFLLPLYDLRWAYLGLFSIPWTLIAIKDTLQNRHNILRNYPVVGHFRYLFEFVRPEIQQYFVATNQSGRPFSREVRSVIYQRAKDVIDTLPFGTQQDIDKPFYNFALHSLAPKKVDDKELRHTIGGPDCTKPYSASRLNISAMSFGALSFTAIETLNWGAQMGGFAHNTGEGGLTPYHTKHRGDIIWQLGTAYFGTRNRDGSFSPTKFKEKSRLECVKMIEIKLSQGAKPSHGGMLPAPKVSEEIANIRGITPGQDCISPPTHSEAGTPLELMDFIQRLRELSGGKPIGFKLCIGLKHEFYSLCKAMIKTNITPDFITVDGAEGGTGAAPLEFSNRLGLPSNEALLFVHHTLIGFNLRDKISLISSGKAATGFDILTKLALGANTVNSARGMMFTLGCIQAVKCNNNLCPSGVATQDKKRAAAVVPEKKRHHVKNFHDNTLVSFKELLGAMGYDSVTNLSPEDIKYRDNKGRLCSYSERFGEIKKGALLGKLVPAEYKIDIKKAHVDAF